jgi:hypothetical protein
LQSIITRKNSAEFRIGLAEKWPGPKAFQIKSNLFSIEKTGNSYL